MDNRYTAYARAFGRTPEEMVEFDKRRFGPGDADHFDAWIKARTREWYRERGFNVEIEMNDSLDADFDWWLDNKIPPLEELSDIENCIFASAGSILDESSTFVLTASQLQVLLRRTRNLLPLMRGNKNNRMWLDILQRNLGIASRCLWEMDNRRLNSYLDGYEEFLNEVEKLCTPHENNS